MSINSSTQAQSARPNLFNHIPSSYLIWLVFMVYLVLVKLAITTVPATFRHVSQAAVFDWVPLGIWTFAGLVGIYFAGKTGFPAALDARVSNRQRFLWPALLGLGFSAVFVALDATSHYNQILAAQYGQPRANIDFPASLLIYPGGAVIVEVCYRLLPIPLLLWLISKGTLRGRGQTQTFWVLALLTSLIEPLTQTFDLIPLGMGIFAAVFLSTFAVNLTQAALFRKYGFLAAIVLRVAFYLVWHIIYVH